MLFYFRHTTLGLTIHVVSMCVCVRVSVAGGTYTGTPKAATQGDQHSSNIAAKVAQLCVSGHKLIDCPLSSRWCELLAIL